MAEAERRSTWCLSSDIDPAPVKVTAVTLETLQINICCIGINPFKPRDDAKSLPMGSDHRRCGSDLLLSLPDDVLGLISSHLRPRDLSSLSLCCRGLRWALAGSDKAWLAQCLRFLPSPSLLATWRPALPSYAALCRFLSSVAPLLGIWVHQNPELGNVVCVAWGPFLSVLACRVIPQELSPNLLWAPVFEITPSLDGAHRCLFLHGRGDDKHDSLYPGSVVSIDPNCNVLLLEVDVDVKHNDTNKSPPPQLQHAKSFSAVVAAANSNLASLRRSASVLGPSPTGDPVQFGKLAFGDRRRLLDLVAARGRQRISPDLEAVPLFPASFEEEVMLANRRLRLIQMHKLSGGGRVDWKAAEISGSIENRKGHNCSNSNGEGIGFTTVRGGGSHGKKRSFFSVVKQIIGRSSSRNLSTSISRNGAASLATSERKHVPLSEFLRAGDTVGLTLRATNMRLSNYRAWPNMHENWFALYKLPLQEPMAEKEYAGLWGGTFGWPPGKTSVDKPGKALFFVLISYEEIEGKLLLIATKILEGTHYVLHPNGSAMFIVRVDEPASESFPWETDGDDVRVEVKHAYAGEGIANGYGFRYPGSKPGSLFEMQNGHLAFVWKESKAVLTLQRLDLEDLLKNGERVPALPPIANFAYLTKSYSNVFAGFPSNSSCSQSLR